MKYLILFLTLLSPTLYAQGNLIHNGSLEEWDAGKPVKWDIITNSVDIFKSDMRIIPLGMTSEHTEFRSKFPDCGHEGLTYFGNAFNEIIQCTFQKPLNEGTIYELSFWVLKPPIPSDITSNKLSVKFSSKPGRENTSHEAITIYETIYKEDSTDFNAVIWENVKHQYIAKGGESFLSIGYFKDINSHLGLEAARIYYLFDDFSLSEKIISTDSISIYFQNDLSNLTTDHIAVLQSLNNLYIDSIHIDGYASDAGDSLYNKELSEKRNAAVGMWLARNEPKTTVTAKAFGETRSLLEFPERYRRVDITAFSSFQPEDIIPSAPCTFDTSLMQLLAKIEAADQQIRIAYDSVFRTAPDQLLLLSEMEKEMKRNDSTNQSQIEEILDHHGYPGITIASPDYMNTAFFVIQHAPLEFREKYFPLVYEASQKGEMNKQLLPYLIDRNNLDNGQNQIYGTQLMWNENLSVFELFPVEDMHQIDELRATYNLEPIKKYVDSFNN